MQTYELMRTPRTEIIHKELSYKIVGLLDKVHDILGRAVFAFCSLSSH